MRGISPRFGTQAIRGDQRKRFMRTAFPLPEVSQKKRRSTASPIQLEPFGYIRGHGKAPVLGHFLPSFW